MPPPDSDRYSLEEVKFPSPKVPKCATVPAFEATVGHRGLRA
jgi:hypothetical protein